jgi:hypothetical protein
MSKRIVRADEKMLGAISKLASKFQLNNRNIIKNKNMIISLILYFVFIFQLNIKVIL